MRLANSMRPLTKAEQRRFFNAGHLRNPPRDPIYVGAFTGAGPASGPRYEDGDTCAVASPYKAGAWEVWIYGMIDPALGNGWNLAQKGLSRGAAIQRAHELLTY